MKASAVANSNIALVKYWGKRDERLILPQNGSISMTTEGMSTHTTVEFDSRYRRDVIILNGKELEESETKEEIVRQMGNIRNHAGSKERAKVMSFNNFPTGAGLASSAGGIAALTAAACEALGLRLNGKELSILARLGSGSACRSIYGGFVEWLRGSREDGKDSYAKQLAAETHWPDFRMVVAVTSKREKKVRSRMGMKASVETSAFYKGWLDSVEEDLDSVRKGILKKDFREVGETAEHNCLKMHSIMLAAKPSILYWLPSTVEIMRNVHEWRENGLECYFTIDAGPQVKLICLEKDIPAIQERLKSIKGVEDMIFTKPGQGAGVTEDHLF